MHIKGRGSALIWILVWLVGVLGIAWTGLNYAVPRFEQKLQVAVEESVSAFNSEPLLVSTSGRQVNISGQVRNETERQSLLAAVNSTPGVGNVIGQLTIIEASSNATLVSNNSTNADNSAQSSPIVTQTADPIALPPAPEELKAQPQDAAKSAVIASKVTNSVADDTKEAPTINIRVIGNILSIEGVMSSTDDSSSLVKSALDSFNLDVVSNGLTLNEDVRSANWLIPLQGIMPLMGTMANARIGVSNQQLTLEGFAPSREAHDAVINEALASLGNFSLIEKISVEGENPNAKDSTLILTANNQTDSLDTKAEQADERAKKATEAATAAKKAEQDKLAAQAAVAAKEKELARQAKLADDAAALAKTQEEARVAAAALAKAEAQKQARLAAEAAALAETQRQARLAAVAAAEAKADEQARIAAAKAKADEQARIAAVAAAKAEADEQARIAAAAAATAKAKADEQARIAAAAAAKAKADEEARIAAKAKADQQALVVATATQAKEQEIARKKAEDATKLTQVAAASNKADLKQALQKLPSLRILFDSQGNTLTADSLDILDQIALTIIEYPDTQVTIEGHTDATGDSNKNLQLSLLRATTVRDYLIRQGVSIYNLRAIGLGEAVPLVSNVTPEGRAKNRRIEFTFR